MVKPMFEERCGRLSISCVTFDPSQNGEDQDNVCADMQKARVKISAQMFQQLKRRSESSGRWPPVLKSNGNKRDQKSTLHLNRGSRTGKPRLSKGTGWTPSVSHFRLVPKSVEFQSPLEVSIFSSSVSDGGSRIRASMSGAETKRELRRARGDTSS